MKKIVGFGNTIYIYSIVIGLMTMFGSHYSNFFKILFEKIILDYYAFFILIYGIILLVLNIIYCLKSWNNQEDNVKIYFINKIIQIPAYTFIFLAGLLFFVSFLGMPMAILLFIIDLFSIVLTGIFSLPIFNQIRKKGIINKKIQIIYSIFSFIFCIDVMIAIIVYIQKKAFCRTNI